MKSDETRYGNLRRFAAFAVVIVLFCSCVSNRAVLPDYRETANWAYFAEGNGKQADLFLVCPTAVSGSDGSFIMNMEDEKSRGKFTGALNMERGIYEETCRMYAPFYRQATLAVYQLPDEKERGEYLESAYRDVKSAFEYYLKYENSGRPIVLAGFSQGADLCIRLARDYFGKEKYRKLLVAVYAIGWRLTEEETAAFSQLKPARGETDTGVIITFSSEAPEVAYSLIVPEKTLAINPLNWQTGSTPATAQENLGACFTDSSGKIVREVPAFCGAYIDPVRGTLKVTGVNEDDFAAMPPLFPRGVYHRFDYQFFYRNLQENVKKRVQTFLIETKKAP